MYKKIPALILCILLLSAAKSQQTDNNYFEGEIHFNISSVSFDERIPQEVLEMENGNTMVGKVKRDKYLMYQNTGGELGKTKMIFLLKEG